MNDNPGTPGWVPRRGEEARRGISHEFAFFWEILMGGSAWRSQGKAKNGGEKKFPQVNILRRVGRPGVKYDRTPDASGVLAPKEPGVGCPGVKI